MARFASPGEQPPFTVPAGVSSVHVVAVGGRGGTDTNAATVGGFGANATADLPVTPGQVLYIEVAGNGGNASGLTAGTAGVNGGAAGAGGTGPSGGGGGGGGGASDIRSLPMSAGVSSSLASRLTTAGGGGGGSGGSAGGGGRGGAAGADGADGSFGSGGKAGTPAMGGAGGGNGGPGVLGAGGGGGGGGIGTGGGGGGGGGSYGGGGGGGGINSGGGGGGGSTAFASSVTSGSSMLDATGVPSVTITYVVPPPGGGTPPPGVPTLPSNDVTIDSLTKDKKGVLTVTGHNGSGGTDIARATTSKTGKLDAKGTKRRKTKPISYGSDATSTPAAGPFRLHIKPTAAANKLLKKGKKLNVSVSVTFQPLGGTPKTKTLAISVRGKKGKKKR